MVNLLTFYGSCGHTTIEQVEDEEWEGADKSYYRIYCCDNSTRMVYVYQSTYFLCVECREEEMYSEEFSALRFLYNSPLSSIHGETKEQREEQILRMGRSLLPTFSDDKLLKVVTKKVLRVEI